MWNLTPLTLISAFACLAALGVLAPFAWLSGQRRSMPGAWSYIFLALALAWWSGFTALEHAAVDTDAKLFFSAVQYPGITSAPVFFFLMALEYSRASQFLSQRLKKFWPLLGIIPAITTLLALTNSRHGLIWREVTRSGDFMIYHHGLLFWVGAVYTYLLMVSGIIILLWSARSLPRYYRTPSYLIVIGVSIPIASNLIYLLGLSLPGLSDADSTPISSLLSCFFLIWAIFYRISLDEGPAAPFLVESRFSKKHYQKILNLLPNAILLVEPPGKIILVNEVCEKLFGYTFHELAGQSIELLLPNHAIAARAIASDDHDLQSLDVEEALACRKDGSQFPAELFFGWLEIDDERSFLLSIRDVSRRNKTLKRLQLQSAALESSASGIAITDIDGNITWVNPAFTTMTGYTQSEVVGQNPRLLKSGMHTPEFYEQMWRTILEGQVWQGETYNRRKDGSVYVEEQTIAPVRSSDKELTHFVATKRDISHRIQLEELRDQLTHTIVHDLRNPLTSILAGLDLLDYWSQQLNLPEEPIEIVQITRSSAWRMLGLVNTILDLSRLEKGQLPIKPEPLVLATLTEQICRVESPLAVRREILLLNDVPFDLPIVYADQHLIGRVLQNLIDNALKFTPDGKSVEIKAHVADENSRQVIVSVRDSGKGIQEEIRHRLFEKYFTQGKQRGAGLGLAFCRMAVEAHGGKIWVESAADPGEKSGATFLFSLPLGNPGSPEN
jgi:PAS domain S-box-containing protein